jgi:hypothetical protein
MDICYPGVRVLCSVCNHYHYKDGTGTFITQTKQFRAIWKHLEALEKRLQGIVDNHHLWDGS